MLRPCCLRFLRYCLLAGLLAGPGSVWAQTGAPPPVSVDPKVETLLSPLSGMPRIQRAEELLWVETEPAAAPAEGADAWLTPSFGTIRPRLGLGKPVQQQRAAASQLWPERSVDRYAYHLPADLLPDLYDLEVAVKPTGTLSGRQASDTQRRAVCIVRSYPKNPRIVVIADPSVGDPRPAQDAATDLVTRNEVNETALLAQRSVGNPTGAERWAAFARVIREVNLARPDFVLVTGDLTFLMHQAATPYEYEDAWQLLDKLEVPAFLTPGNHDLYALDEMAGTTPGESPQSIDGRELWLKYFGPLYYATDAGPRLHLLSLNTFEWPRNDPFPVEDEFDTRAAGNLSAAQFAWAMADLKAYRERSPEGTIVSFAHHDPSWMQRRHAWTGEHRLELRDLFAAMNVGVHFSGHTHEDRVARYYQGDVVETNGRPHVDGHVVKTLHLLKRDGSLDTAPSQAALGAILRDPSQGPLFVSTTSASSQLIGDIWGLGGYWGWRLATLSNRDGKGSLDPAEFGYPITDDYLATRAERPEHWTAEHAQYGLFSYPSYELDYSFSQGTEAGSPYAEITVTSRLLAPLDIGPLLTLAASEGQFVEALGDSGLKGIVQLRYGEGRGDVRLAATVPPLSTQRYRVRYSKQATVLLPPPASELPPPPVPSEPGIIQTGIEAGRSEGRFGGGALPLLLLLLMAAAALRGRRRG